MPVDVRDSAVMRVKDMLDGGLAREEEIPDESKFQVSGQVTWIA